MNGERIHSPTAFIHKDAAELRATHDENWLGCSRKVRVLVFRGIDNYMKATSGSISSPYGMSGYKIREFDTIFHDDAAFVTFVAEHRLQNAWRDRRDPDSLLMVSGNLDLGPGGEHPFAPEPHWRYTQHRPFIGADEAFANSKRSVYLMQQRIRRQPFLDLFDGSDTNAETGIRPLTDHRASSPVYDERSLLPRSGRMPLPHA